MSTRFPILAGALAIAATLAFALPAEAGQLHRVQGPKVPDGYIVVMKSTALTTPAGLARAHGLQPEHVYGNSVVGFSTHIPPQALQRILSDPDVDYIEENGYVYASPGANAKPPWAGGGNDDGGSAAQETPWGITRVGGGATYTGRNKAWVIDTGVDLDHPDLNVAPEGPGLSVSFVTKGRNKPTSADDQNGHGTHVAGTIAAIDNEIGVVGVAAGATVVSVRVLDRQGSGSYATVIAGVDYVAQHGSSGDVANMSLGGPISESLDDAVLTASGKGIYFSLAAGNESDDANNSSPARVNGNNIYTISAIAEGDGFASFSNYGNPPIDFAAPGVYIKSTWKDGSYDTISGTSMAAPHVAGILLWGPPHSDGTASEDPDGNADPIATTP